MDKEYNSFYDYIKFMHEQVFPNNVDIEHCCKWLAKLSYTEWIDLGEMYGNGKSIRDRIELNSSYKC